MGHRSMAARLAAKSRLHEEDGAWPHPKVPQAPDGSVVSLQEVRSNKSGVQLRPCFAYGTHDSLV